jgi:3-oxoacyl-[acyl-carrier-protein] synthase II
MRRVVITGVGLVCALGDRPSLVHDALSAGRRGLEPSTLLANEASGYLVGEVQDFDARRYFGARNLRPLSRTGRLAAVAAELALADSGWPVERRAATEVGLVLGTMFGSAGTIGEFDRRAMREGPEYASPLDFANTVISAPAGQVAIWHHLRGMNSTISTGLASGLHAIGYAWQLIRDGRAATLLAGGAEELCFESFLGFRRAGLLCGPGGEGPRPFDRRRSGCALGEGAGFLVLEAADAAAARGAPGVGRVEGFGATYEPRPSAEPAKGPFALTLAIERALSGTPGDISAVMASASGDRFLDHREGVAIREALGARAAYVPVTTIKGHLGEPQGAGGALQAIVTLESLRAKSLPPIGGLEQLEEGLGLDVVIGQPRKLTSSRALVTSVAREGNACALVLAAD